VSDEQIGDFNEWVDQNSAGEKPVIELPGGEVSITDCAGKLFGLIAPTKTLFVRGGAPVALQAGRRFACAGHPAPVGGAFFP